MSRKKSNSMVGTSEPMGRREFVAGAAATIAVQERHRGAALHDRSGDRIRVLLVRVAGLAQPTAELNSAALLDDVRGLVGGGEQVRGRLERHVVPRGVGARAQLLRRRARRAADMGADAGDVVVPE